MNIICIIFVRCRLKQNCKISITGSISHHHGVGKLRKKWYTDTVSEPGRQLLLAAKKTLDPDNIFALGNMALHENTDEDNVSVKSKLWVGQNGVKTKTLCNRSKAYAFRFSKNL